MDWGTTMTSDYRHSHLRFSFSSTTPDLAVWALKFIPDPVYCAAHRSCHMHVPQIDRRWEHFASHLERFTCKLYNLQTLLIDNSSVILLNRKDLTKVLLIQKNVRGKLLAQLTLKQRNYSSSGFDSDERLFLTSNEQQYQQTCCCTSAFNCLRLLEVHIESTH